MSKTARKISKGLKVVTNLNFNWLKICKDSYDVIWVIKIIKIKNISIFIYFLYFSPKIDWVWQVTSFHKKLKYFASDYGIITGIKIKLCKNSCRKVGKNKSSQAIQSPRTLLFFLLISLLDEYSLANVHVKGIVAFKHLKKLWHWHQSHTSKTWTCQRYVHTKHFCEVILKSVSRWEGQNNEKSFLLTATVTLTLALLCWNTNLSKMLPYLKFVWSYIKISI